MMSLHLSHWDSPEYDIAHFVLAVLYILLSLFSLAIFISLIRHQQVHLAWQKFFHPLLILGCLVRATFFSLQPLIFENVILVDNKVNTLLNTLPSFLFFSDYLIILFLWVEIYHNAKDGSGPGIEKFRPLFLGVNLIMYAVAATLYALDYIMYPKSQYDNVSVSRNNVQRAIYLFGVSIYFFTSLGFFFYGIRIYSKFASIPIYNKSRRKIQRKIMVITTLVNLCFLARVGIIIPGALYNFSKHWWFDLVYYTILEMIPLTLMIFILHGTPKRRSKDNSSSSETAPLNN